MPLYLSLISDPTNCYNGRVVQSYSLANNPLNKIQVAMITCVTPMTFKIDTSYFSLLGLRDHGTKLATNLQRYQVDSNFSKKNLLIADSLPTPIFSYGITLNVRSSRGGAGSPKAHCHSEP